jgi:hypothetical protein
MALSPMLTNPLASVESGLSWVPSSKRGEVPSGFLRDMYFMEIIIIIIINSK